MMERQDVRMASRRSQADNVPDKYLVLAELSILALVAEVNIRHDAEAISPASPEDIAAGLG